MKLLNLGVVGLAISLLSCSPHELKGADLSLAEPSGPSTPLLRVTGRLSGEQLTLTLRGEGWSQSFRMRQEQPLVSRWRKISEIDLSSTPPGP